MAREVVFFLQSAQFTKRKGRCCDEQEGIVYPKRSSISSEIWCQVTYQNHLVQRSGSAPVKHAAAIKAFRLVFHFVDKRPKCGEWTISLGTLGALVNNASYQTH